MHYKDGKPAQEGDVVRGKTHSTTYEVTGVITDIIPGSTTCNATVWHCVPYSRNLDRPVIPLLGQATANCSDLELVHRRK